MERYEKHKHSELANDKIWSDERLGAEAIRIGNMLREPYYTGERRRQVSRSMGLIAFEQFMRFQEAKIDDVPEF